MDPTRGWLSPAKSLTSYVSNDVKGVDVSETNKLPLCLGGLTMSCDWGLPYHLSPRWTTTCEKVAPIAPRIWLTGMILKTTSPRNWNSSALMPLLWPPQLAGKELVRLKPSVCINLGLRYTSSMHLRHGVYAGRLRWKPVAHGRTSNLGKNSECAKDLCHFTTS